MLAVATADGSVQLFDATTRKALLQFKGDEAAVCSVAFAPDGNTMATGGQDRNVHIWDVHTGKSIAILEAHKRSVTSVAFTPDGKMLLSGSLDRTVCQWDLKTCKLLRTLDDHRGRVTSIALCLDGKTMACGYLMEGNTMIDRKPFDIYKAEAGGLWDVTTGKELRQLRGAGQQIALSPDGKHYAAAELRTEIVLEPYNHRIRNGGSSLYKVMGSPVIKGKVTISVGDLATGAIRFQLVGQGTALAFSPDGSYLATAGGSDFLEGGKILQPPNPVPIDGRIRLWEIATGQEVLAFPSDAGATILAFAPDHCTLAAGTKDGNVELWDLAPTTTQGRPGLDAEASAGLWKQLNGEDAAAAYQARWALLEAPNKGVPYLEERMRVKPIFEPEVCRLVVDLDAETLALRDGASRELKRLGTDAQVALSVSLQLASSTTLRQRIAALLNSPTINQPGDVLGQVRAVSVLEANGSASAREQLEMLSKGPPLAEQTQAARLALERLQHRPATLPDSKEAK
jgi:hypothetical protein